MAKISPYLDKYVSPRGYPKLKYPSPWFDLSRDYFPKNIKTLFKYCRTFFYRNGFLNSVITKLAEYPITDILYDKDVNPKTKEMYEILLNYDLNIQRVLVEIGLDFFTYGNCIISAMMKFHRYLQCPECGTQYAIDDIEYKWKGFQFFAKCENCQAASKAWEIVDKRPKNKNFFRLIRWSPENIDIDYDQLTGESTYIYKIPGDLKAKITKGHKATLKRTPKLFIEALSQKKEVELDTSNLFHFKRPSLAEEDMGWGKPIVLSALSDIWYMQTLKRANEAIAAEHIIPFRMLYPSSQGHVDPFTEMSLGAWRSKLEDDLDRWKQDPNYIGIFPIPVGMTNVGGDARLLLVTQELRFVEESIVQSLGVPLEFIKGGTSWTGSSISLRIVENHFLNYRNLLEDFLNQFLVKKLNDFISFPIVDLKFKRLRMADDSESKKLAIELNSTEKISDARLLDDFGYDYKEERESIEESQKSRRKMALDMALVQAEAEAKSQEILAKATVRAQAAAIEEKARIREEMFLEEIAAENNEDLSSANISYNIARWSEEVIMMDSASQTKVLGELAKTKPVTYTMIMQRIQEKQVEEMQIGMQTGMIQREEQSTSSNGKPKPKQDTRKPEAEKQRPGAPKDGSV